MVATLFVWETLEEEKKRLREENEPKLKTMRLNNDSAKLDEFTEKSRPWIEEVQRTAGKDSKDAKNLLCAGRSTHLSLDIKENSPRDHLCYDTTQFRVLSLCSVPGNL